MIELPPAARLGLHELGLLPGVRYVSGVSGGAWAAAAYTFFDPSSGSVRPLYRQ